MCAKTIDAIQPLDPYQNVYDVYICLAHRPQCLSDVPNDTSTLFAVVFHCGKLFQRSRLVPSFLNEKFVVGSVLLPYETKKNNNTKHTHTHT